jgi:hypothetical protein
MEAIHVLILLGHSLVNHHQRDHVRHHRRASRRRGQRDLAIVNSCCRGKRGARAWRMVRGAVMRVLERLDPFVAESSASEANSLAA